MLHLHTSKILQVVSSALCVFILLSCGENRIENDETGSIELTEQVSKADSIYVENAEEWHFRPGENHEWHAHEEHSAPHHDDEHHDH